MPASHRTPPGGAALSRRPSCPRMTKENFVYRSGLRVPERHPLRRVSQGDHCREQIAGLRHGNSALRCGRTPTLPEYPGASVPRNTWVTRMFSTGTTGGTTPRDLRRNAPIPSPLPVSVVSGLRVRRRAAVRTSAPGCFKSTNYRSS
jgi:hypothetical protein